MGRLELYSENRKYRAMLETRRRDMAELETRRRQEQDMTKNNKPKTLKKGQMPCPNPECGKPYHARAKVCPHCNFPNPAYDAEGKLRSKTNGKPEKPETEKKQQVQPPPKHEEQATKATVRRLELDLQTARETIAKLQATNYLYKLSEEMGGVDVVRQMAIDVEKHFGTIAKFRNACNELM